MQSETRTIQSIMRELKLGTIGFKIIDSVPDHEIAYTVFKHKAIEITIEPGFWFCELYIGSEAIKMEGVQSVADIQTLKNLIYGKEDC